MSFRHAWPGLIETPRMSWLANLLPYLEQTALWEEIQQAYQKDRNPFHNPPHRALSFVVNAFNCPSDYRVVLSQPTHEGLQVALTSFVGVLGVNFSMNDGVLTLDSRVKISEVTDGAATTLIVGERPPSSDFWYGWWFAGVGQAGTGSLDMLLGVREINSGARYSKGCESGPHHFGMGSINSSCDHFHFWSLHPGGSHFLSRDNAVVFLGYSADIVVPMLATRNAGDIVEMP